MGTLSRPSPSQTFVVVVNVVISKKMPLGQALRMIVALIMSIVVPVRVVVVADHAATIHVGATIVAPKKSPSAAVKTSVVILMKNNVVVGMRAMRSVAIRIMIAAHVNLTCLVTHSLIFVLIHLHLLHRIVQHQFVTLV